MKQVRRILIGAILMVAVLWAAWILRWETVITPQENWGGFYRVDRWTGDVVYISRDGEIEIPGPGLQQSTRR
jgi:hypothetical protein